MFKSSGSKCLTEYLYDSSHIPGQWGCFAQILQRELNLIEVISLIRYIDCYEIHNFDSSGDGDIKSYSIVLTVSSLYDSIEY